MNKKFTIPENVKIESLGGRHYAARLHNNTVIYERTADRYEYLNRDGVWRDSCADGWFSSNATLMKALKKSFKINSTSPTAEEKITKALDFAVKYGGIDGAHHKDWVIDQIVRALTGCPEVNRRMKDANGKAYSYTEQGKSDDYKKLIKEAKAGEDGPNTYSWETGICP